MSSAPGSPDCSRRTFLLATGTAALGSTLLGCAATGGAARRYVGTPECTPTGACFGPGARYTPTLRVAFVRRRGEYGMLWPGQVYDGEAALRDYRSSIESAVAHLGMHADIRTEPIYTPEEGSQWVEEAKAARPDGLLVVLLDRQQHAWPTAVLAMDAQIPTIVFAPVGAAFTVNTRPVANRTGVLICSTDDFNQVTFGLRMIRAGAKLREMRYIVLKGNGRRDEMMLHLGTKLRYVPASAFLDEYNRTATSSEIERMTGDYLARATRLVGATREDVTNGIKSYVVARKILEREEGDGITMDCLGALGKSRVSLPCIAWSRMLDNGIPAACEADLGAAVTHALVQQLFDRPGFQQDPVPETAKGCLIGAHCSCATRLNGFACDPEPFDLIHHHGNRDAVPRTTWRVGQRMTVVSVVPSREQETPPEMIISTGEVVENVSVPPSGGCVVSVMVKLDGVSDLLAYPGFHQLFVYGDYRAELQSYCRLFKIRPQVV